jgi:peptidoglycan-associated lipoprotein
MKNFNIKLFVALLIVIVAACMPKAQKAYMKGEKKFKQGEYEFAIQYFQDALSKGYADKALPNYYIAESYRLSNRIQESEKYYKEAIENKTNQEEAYFYYGFAQKAIGNYEGAEETLKNYVKIGNNFDFINRAKNEIENLKVLNHIVNRKSYYTINKIDHLNTKEEEYSPVYFNGKLYFTSSRGAEKMHAATGTGFTDLYEFIFDGVDKHSGQAKRMHEVLNTNDAHEASAVFSKDGKTVFFARSNTGSRKGSQDVDIFMATVNPDGTWGEPVKLPFNDDNAWDSCPALSADGNTLYFSSNREGGNGGNDLYKVYRNPDGTWGPAINMGTPVNTRGNEMFPYENSSKEFFFASDGHPSLGKLDIFMLKKDEKGKVYVENLGKGINTSYDDFAINYRDSIYGYIASDRPGGEGGDDIYEFKDESKIKVITYWLDISVFYTEKDSPGREFILPGATLKIANQKGDTIAVLLSDSLGKASTQIDPETYYTLVGSKTGYLTEETKVSTMGKKVDPNKLKTSQTEIRIPIDVKLTLPKKEKIKFVVDNIYYDFDKANIRPDAAIELYKIVEFMRLNPDISIELSSHTDSRGSNDYNKKLSQRRADSAVAYIVSKGIAKERITAKGYGEERPLEIVDSTGAKTVYNDAYINKLPTKEEKEKAHDKNRRTEIQITNIKESSDTKIRRREEEGGGFILEKEN